MRLPLIWRPAPSAAVTPSVVSRPVGLFFAAYAGVILLGSVHTGWHYAVDGYAGIALAAACWWICGPVARWYMGLAATRRYNEGLASL
mgnify:CR=1 FL=1